MSQYPALESELEKNLRADGEGVFVKDLQRSLSDFVAAVEYHTRDGMSLEQYQQWRELQKAAEAASVVAEEVRLRMHEK